MLEHALKYAARGWPVLPLKPQGKTPLTSHGLKDASTSETVIKHWWERWPDANIGVATGEDAGVWVLDIDGPEGSASLTQLETELGVLPETLDQQTGGGGRHLFFEWPAGTEVRNRANVRKGIDVRGEGGYVIVPPSVHPNGVRYEWTSGDGGRICKAPAALLTLLSPRKAEQRPPWERVDPAPQVAPIQSTQAPVIKRAKKYLAECDAAVQGSGGHNALLWAARALVVGFQLDDTTALSLLWSEYNPRCTPPWDYERDRRDFERKVSEARRTPGEKPAGWLLDHYNLRSSTESLAQIAKGQEAATRLLAAVAKEAIENPIQVRLDEHEAEVQEVLERREFPADLFPAPIEEYCRKLADSHSVDLSFACLPVIAAAGASMGNAWRLELKRGFKVPPIVWVGLVSPSGTNKSGPLRDVMAPLRKVIPQDKVVESMLNPQGRMVVSDATTEAVVARLQEQPRGLMVFRDELAGWCRGFNAYKQKGGDEQTWLELWGGGPYLVDRKTNDEQISIPAASCCVLGGIQPKVLVDCFDPGRFASGLVPRILISCPPENDMFWTETEVGAATEAAWEQVVFWLRSRPFHGLDTNQGKFKPHVLTLSDEAKAAYVAFFNALSLERAQMADENCKSLVSKGRVIAGRLALIHHGLLSACSGEESFEKEVGAVSVRAACAWTRWCLEEQIRVYGFGAKKHREEAANYLVGSIRSKLKSKLATARQVQRINNRRYPNTSAATAAMSQLVDMGLAIWTDEKQKQIELVRVNGAQAVEA